MRMFPESFKVLVNLLNTHSIFQSNNVKQQAPVELQLAVFLRRLTQEIILFLIGYFLAFDQKTLKKIGLKVRKMVALHKPISPIKINLNPTEKCDRPEMNRANKFVLRNIHHNPIRPELEVRTGCDNRL